MKTSFISNYAIRAALQHTNMQAQKEITETRTEVVTGKYADIGKSLGSLTSQTLLLHNDILRFDSLIDNNALAEQRLTTSQNTLEQIADNAQEMLNALIVGKSATGSTGSNVVERNVDPSFDAFLSMMNTRSNGEYIFAGINSDIEPVTAYEAGSPAKVAFDAAFLARFGFTQASPAVSTITAAQMDTFLTTDVEPMFNTANWTANWSSASDTNVNSRISTSETVASSTSANGKGFRDFALAAVISKELLQLDLQPDVSQSVYDRAIEHAGTAISGVNSARTDLGISEARVKKANESLKAQKDVVALYLNDLEGVDAYEASTKLTSLMTQMEASYKLTARIQQLSLMNYL